MICLVLVMGDIANVKVRFNQANSTDDPLEMYKMNPDIVNNQWFLWRTKRSYFKVDQIAICFLKLSNDRWLLTTIKEITKDLGIYEGINYEGNELEEFKSYYGRVIVSYHKTSQPTGALLQGNISRP